MPMEMPPPIEPMPPIPPAMVAPTPPPAPPPFSGVAGVAGDPAFGFAPPPYAAPPQIHVAPAPGYAGAPVGNLRGDPAPRFSPPRGVPIPPQARPQSVPPPPLGARPQSTGSAELHRPGDVTSLVHMHDDAILEGTTVEIGPDDTFYGVVSTSAPTAGGDGSRTVAFALMTGLRKTPQTCVGYFVSRGTEGVELAHEVGELEDAQGSRGRFVAHGSISFEIVDPARLLASEADLDDEPLAGLVSRAVGIAAAAATRDALAAGDVDLASLERGAADGRLLERATSERFAPKLWRSHGIAWELSALRVRVAEAMSSSTYLAPAPAMDPAHAPSTARSAPPSAAEHPGLRPLPSEPPPPVEDSAKSASSATSARLPVAEDMAPSAPTFFERPTESAEIGELLWVVSAAMPVGGVLGVRMDDGFIGVRGDGTLLSLPPGRHRLEEALAGGLFVLQTGESTPFGAQLGVIQDFKGIEGSVRAFGKVEVHIDDPEVLVRSFAAPLRASGDELLASVRAALTEVLRQVVRDGLGGEWDLASVADPTEIEEVIRRCQKGYERLATRVAGTSIEILELAINVGSPDEAKPPLTQPEPHTRPSEREEINSVDGEPWRHGDDDEEDDRVEMTAIRPFPVPAEAFREPREPREPRSVELTPVVPDSDEHARNAYDARSSARIALDQRPWPEPATTRRGSDHPEERTSHVSEEWMEEHAKATMVHGSSAPAAAYKEPAAPWSPDQVQASPVAWSHPQAQSRTPAPEASSPYGTIMSGEPPRAHESSSAVPASAIAVLPVAPVAPIAHAPALRPVPSPVPAWQEPPPPPPPPAYEPQLAELSVDHSPVPAAASPSAAPYEVGTQVMVMWSDGNQYQGQVHEASGDHYLVVFTNGMQQWVPFAAMVVV